MTITMPVRPDTTMGRALAGRALRLTEAIEASGSVTSGSTTTDLTVGVTSLAPPHVRQAASDALARGETHYTSRPGVVELRRAIARQVSEDGFPATAETVVVTNGGAEAIYIALQAILEPGDTIAMPEPIQPNIAAMIAFIGAELVRVPTVAGDRFLPTVDALLDSSAATVLLASPSPITGAALSPEQTRTLAAGTAERNMTLILDRSYAPAAYVPESLGFGAPELGASVVTIGSFSAGFGLDGWRVGYFTAPPDRMGKMRGLKQAMSICTTAVSQFAALAALEGPTGWLDQRREAFSERRDTVMKLLADAGLAAIVPDAYSALLVDVSSIDADDRRFAQRLASEDGIRVQPGSDFGPATAGFIRIDLGSGETGDALIAAVRRITATATEGSQA